MNNVDESKGYGWAEAPPINLLTRYLEHGTGEVKEEGMYNMEVDIISANTQGSTRTVFWLTASESDIISTEHNWLTVPFMNTLVPTFNDQVLIQRLFDDNVASEWAYFNMPATITTWVPSHLDWQSPDSTRWGTMGNVHNRVYSYFPDLLDYDGAGTSYYDSMTSAQRSFFDTYMTTHSFYVDPETRFSASFKHSGSYIHPSGIVVVRPSGYVIGEMNEDCVDAWEAQKANYVKPIADLEPSFLIRRISLTVAAILEEIYNNGKITNSVTGFVNGHFDEIYFPTMNGLGYPILIPDDSGTPYVISSSEYDEVMDFLNNSEGSYSGKQESLINFYRYGLTGDGWENTTLMYLMGYGPCLNVIGTGDINLFGGKGPTDPEYEALYFWFQTPYGVAKAIDFIFNNFNVRKRKLIKQGNFFSYDFYSYNSDNLDDELNNSNAKDAHSLPFLKVSSGEEEKYNRLDFFVTDDEDPADEKIPTSELQEQQNAKYTPTEIVALNRQALKTAYDLMKRPSSKPEWPLDASNTNAYDYAYLHV